MSGATKKRKARRMHSDGHDHHINKELLLVSFDLEKTDSGPTGYPFQLSMEIVDMYRDDPNDKLMRGVLVAEYDEWAKPPANATWNEEAALGGNGEGARSSGSMGGAGEED